MRVSFFLLPSLILASCGYSPLYAPVAGGGAAVPVHLGSVAMAKVEIEPGQRLVAQEVWQRLAQAFAGAEGVQLAVEITETTTALALERTATVRRAEIALTGAVQLIGADGKRLLAVNVGSVAAYNVENNPFSTESGKSFARQLAARALAENIVRRVTLWQRTATPAAPIAP
jgi:hypothetical protein